MSLLTAESGPSAALNAARRFDPTRTTGLRNRFAREMRKRWLEVRVAVAEAIVEQDVFGIQPKRSGIAGFQALPARAFAFESDPKKLQLFMEWMQQLEEEHVLSARQHGPASGLRLVVGGGAPRSAGGGWTDDFMFEAYTKGIAAARKKLTAAGYHPELVGALPDQGGAYLITPQHRARVELLFSRTFEDLKTVRDQVNADARRKLSDALTTKLSAAIAAGTNPRVVAQDLAKELNGSIVKIGVARAEAIARTEIIRAHHLATIQEFRRVDESMAIDVEAEWLTAGYNVCPICKGLAAGGPYTLDEIEEMLPAHPNCRCAAKPKVKAHVEGGGGKDVVESTPVPAATPEDQEFTTKETVGREDRPDLDQIFLDNKEQFDAWAAKLSPDGQQVIEGWSRGGYADTRRAYEIVSHLRPDQIEELKELAEQLDRERSEDDEDDQDDEDDDDDLGVSRGYDEEEYPELKAMQLVERFDSALASAPRWTGKVWRGIDVGGTNVDTYLEWLGKTGETIEWAAPASTTVDPAIGLNFAKGLLFEIKMKRGAAIWQMSDHPNEFEVVSLPGSRFRVVKTLFINDGSQILVQLEEI